MDLGLLLNQRRMLALRQRSQATGPRNRLQFRERQYRRMEIVFDWWRRSEKDRSKAASIFALLLAAVPPARHEGLCNLKLSRAGFRIIKILTTRSADAVPTFCHHV
ncbi:hypothetical protein GGC65_001287 [Sphingopyxis sp. OAS728]|uniref:hypothetical protein n=1 Tax=Sphingopyxis sp. OAS728 TaxID=2663823 RepID=UPI00178A89B1|nr:hypothetical protein [Sphingopyxis sp. OAS728]MBE1526831.1 hypothetical protein [Sphingopyxis sp. OAS728]